MLVLPDIYVLKKEIVLKNNLINKFDEKIRDESYNKVLNFFDKHK